MPDWALFLISFLWFVLPGAMGNAAPVIVKDYFKELAGPIDGGATFRGKRVLGDHKTWRGIIAGSLFGLVVGGLQGLLYSNFEFARDISIIDLSGYHGLFFGFLMGFGALLGDAIKSFFKRQVGIAPGKSFVPWDQIDTFFGVLLVVYWFYSIPIEYIVFGLFFVPVLHVGINLLGYYLGIKENKF